VVVDQGLPRVILVQDEEEDLEEEGVEEAVARERIFQGKTPVIPSEGLLLPLENGKSILILRGSELGPADNEMGFRFKYGKGEVRVMGPATPYPNGYVVLNDAAGNPITLEGGVPKSRAEYHYPLAP